MPGTLVPGDQVRPITDLLDAEEYITQLRSTGAWHLPNHNEPEALTRRQVAAALRRARDRNAPGTVRFGRDTDGTVSVSDHEWAAGYLPTGLIPDHRDRHLPGCHAPYATLGDSPCDPAD